MSKREQAQRRLAESLGRSTVSEPVEPARPVRGECYSCGVLGGGHRPECGVFPGLFRFRGGR